MVARGAGNQPSVWYRSVVAGIAVASLALLCACAGSRPSAATNQDGSGSAEAVSPWSEGLVQMVNGPVPSIVVDQFGYRPQSEKVAVLRQPVEGYDAGSAYIPGAEIQLIDAGSGERRYSAKPHPWHSGAVDAASGDRAWWFDFSSVSSPGRYYVFDPSNMVRSPEFEIADDVYAPVLREALRTFFYQRAGQDKSPDSAGDAWADGASHLGPGQDGEARSWLAKDDPRTALDLSGGWYDAGDYNKYTAWHADYILTLLHTFSENRSLVGDDLQIPESGNGISDLLDEVDWGVSWLTKMQNPDGSVLCIEGLASGSPPSAADGPSYYGPPTTFATLQAAAAFAYAATVYRSSGVGSLIAKSQALEEQASSAWEWAADNPSVTYYNNDEVNQPGSSGLGAGQQETDDQGRAGARLRAAVYLYGLTDRPTYRDFVDHGYLDYLPAGTQNQWTVTKQETLLHFASLAGVDEQVAEGIQADYVDALENGADFMGAVKAETDPYRAPLAEYTWGSNQYKSAMGRMFGLATVYGLDTSTGEPARNAAEGFVHYLHGVNPLGLVYLTNMSTVGAENSASTLYHTWFTDGSDWDVAGASVSGPAPGFVVGGPNPQYSGDPCCAESPQCGSALRATACADDLSPPIGQPPMKSYRQFNDGWPTNSWEVTENSNANQVQYIRLLAGFV